MLLLYRFQQYGTRSLTKILGALICSRCNKLRDFSCCRAQCTDKILLYRLQNTVSGLAGPAAAGQLHYHSRVVCSRIL